MATFSVARLRLTLFAAIAASAFCLRLQAADDGTNKFGFTGPEIFPIDSQISLLHAADLDGDGLNDLIVVNNLRSKINLLYNRTGKTNAIVEDKNHKKELNELPPDARFRIDSIASEKRITSLVVADLNGDGKPDLAYYGDPKELVVQYNEGTNGWSLPKRWPIDDGQMTANALVSGDLNGDKRKDLVLLGENNIYFLPQQADKTFGEPQKISLSGVVKAVHVLDIDGNGRDDLLLVNWDSPNPFRFRLQNSEGQLGPEVHFTLPPIRAYWSDDLDGDHKTEIITIAQNSGRAEVANFMRKDAQPLAGAFKEGQFQVFPLNKTTRARRGIEWADINGDGLPDLLVAEPDSGQLTVWLQKPDGSLAAPQSFPTLTGVSDIAVSDWDGETHAQIRTEYAEKKDARTRSLQSGLAWQILDKVAGDELRQGTMVQRLFRKPIDRSVPLHNERCWQFMRSIAHFASFDHPFAGILRSAISRFAIEKGFDAEAVMEAPVVLLQHVGSAEIVQFCDWIDSGLHELNHRLWHFAPVMFDPDPKARQFASFGLYTRHVRLFDETGQTVWRQEAARIGEAIEEPVNAKHFEKGFSDNKPRVWNYQDVDRAVIRLWPLVKRHNWTYADLMKTIRPHVKRPKFYPCHREQSFATYCTNVLGLRKTGKGRTSKGEPIGAEVVSRLLGIKG